MTETSAPGHYERLADHIEETYPAPFDPLPTMDAIKWETELGRAYPEWPRSQLVAVAEILEARHFQGWV